MKRIADLTKISDEKLADYWHEAMDEYDELRAEKARCQAEHDRRQAIKSLEPVLNSLTPDQQKALAQHVSSAGAIESAEKLGTPGQ